MYKLLILLVITITIFTGCDCEIDETEQAPKAELIRIQTGNGSEFFHGDFCRQSTAKTDPVDSAFVEALVNDEWHQYPLRTLPEGFIQWNVKRRIETIDRIESMMAGEGHASPDLAGPHNAIVATIGYRREDSGFSLNNAVKGMGFLPKREKIKELMQMLDETAEKPMPDRLKLLREFYDNLEDWFAMDRQVSLELYSQPEFVTQSFLNQMQRPVSTVVFLDIPSYKLKTVSRLLDPKDPQLTDYEKDVVQWINKIHSFFHGQFSKDFIAVIYYVVEVYDNSPRGRDPEKGMGRRVVPPLP